MKSLLCRLQTTHLLQRYRWRETVVYKSTIPSKDIITNEEPPKTICDLDIKEEIKELKRIKANGPNNSGEHSKVVTKRRLFDSKILPLGIRDEKDARFIMEKLLPGERKLLFDSLRKKTVDQYMDHKRLGNAHVHSDDTRAIWYIYFIPSFLYGLFANTFLITIGEEIDSNFGAILDISIMASAATSNLIVNLAGIYIPTLVEKLMQRWGTRRPVLSAEQLANRGVKFIVILAKIVGLVAGCITGMFPLFLLNPIKRVDLIEKESPDDVSTDVEVDEVFQSFKQKQEKVFTEMILPKTKRTKWQGDFLSTSVFEDYSNEENKEPVIVVQSNSAAHPL